MSLTVALLLLTQLGSLQGLGTDELPMNLPILEAVLGGTAQLTCTYRPGSDLILYWSRPGPDSDRTFYTYYRGKHLTQHDDPAYRGRATVPAGQPEHGNGTLWLRNLTLADEGRYRCRVKSDNSMSVAEMELRLIGYYHLSWLQDKPCSPSLQNVTLTCLAEGGYPPATITIHDSSGRGYGVGPLATRNPQGLYNITHTAVVSCSPNTTYLCVINTTFHQQNCTWALILEEHAVGPQLVWKGWPGMGLGIGLAVVVLVSGALWAGSLGSRGERGRATRDPAREEALLDDTIPNCQRQGDPPDTLLIHPHSANTSCHAPVGSLSPMALSSPMANSRSGGNG